MNRERRRVTLALLLSLLVHGLLLGLTFGGQGLGLPGFGFPWQDRRIEAPDLRLVLVPEQRVAEDAPAPLAPLQQTRVEPLARLLPLTPPVSSAPTPRPMAPAAAPKAPPSEKAIPKARAATDGVPAKTPLPTEPSNITAPASAPEPPVIDAAPSDDAARQEAAQRETARVESERREAERQAAAQQEAARQEAEQRETARVESERQEAERQTVVQQEAARREAEQRETARVESERQEATRQEAARQAAARQEAARQEATRQEAASQEAARQEATRQEAARQEAASQEAARQEAARQEAARQDAARQETARQDAARQETARQDAARQEAARQEAARQEAGRQEAARQEAARNDAAREAAARREAALQAIGRQLNEEAARRDAASTPSRASPSGSYRRARLFGRADANAALILYAEAWERKIQLNMTFDMVREAAKLPHTDPIVTVAIRSDGSVESVTFVVSSGAPALDEAIRRVVQSQEHYQAFPPELAREYDVIEIRRTWRFDMAIRLY